MKRTSYQRLKDKLKESQAETAKIRSDFKKVLIDKDVMLTSTYTMQFKMDGEFEKQLWMGEVAVYAEIKPEHINVYKDK